MTISHQELRRLTAEASRQQAAVDTEIGRRRTGPPAAGDLYVLAETAEHPIEWAILERDPLDPERLLAVPADTNSLVGGADVAVRAGSRGSLSLRCAYPTWIDADAFDPELRTGFLEPEFIEQALRKRDSLQQGEIVGSVLEREVDGETEYREWREVLDRAVAAIPGRTADAQTHDDPAASAPAEPGASDPDTETAKPGRLLPFGRRSDWGKVSGMLALAASVLLVMTLGLGRELMQSSNEHQAVVAEQRDALTRLEQERQQLVEGHRRDLARLDEERKRLELEHRERIAELEASAGPKPAVNLPLLILTSSQLRGNADTLEVTPDADSLMLILQVDDPRAFERYRLEIREAAGRQVWRDSSLEPSRLAGLTALLPRSLIPDGRYELRLHGLTDGRPERLMERILIVTTRGDD